MDNRPLHHQRFPDKSGGHGNTRFPPGKKCIGWIPKARTAGPIGYFAPDDHARFALRPHHRNALFTLGQPRNFALLYWGSRLFGSPS